MVPGVNIISRNASVASIDQAGQSGGAYEPFSRGFKGRSSQEKKLRL